MKEATKRGLEPDQSKELAAQKAAENSVRKDAVQVASEQSFPASDSPAWNAWGEQGQRTPSIIETDQGKEGCAISFLMEERDELDPLCGRTPEETRGEYVQPDDEKEDGGEG